MAARRLVTAAMAVIVLSTVFAASAAAVDGTWVKKLSDCVTFSWKGNELSDWSYSMPGQSLGTGRQCVYLYKESETDPNADYWMMVQDVTWTVTTDATNPFYNGSYDNPATGIITSSAIASDWDATNTATMHGGGCGDVSVSVGIPGTILGFGVGVTLCQDGTSLKLISQANNGARWDTDDIVYTPKWSSAYVQRVTPGTKPTFKGYVYYPNYSVYYTGKQRCQYYCFPVWGVYPYFKTSMLSLSL